MFFHTVFSVMCIHIIMFTILLFLTVAEDMTTYTTLIADVQEVQDDSSDFELPEAVVA